MSKMSSKSEPLGKISDELAEFLNKPKDTIMTRLDVSREFYNYIKINNLKNRVDKGTIIIDDKLAKLFKLKKTDYLTYGNYSSKLSSHFKKICVNVHL